MNRFFDNGLSSLSTLRLRFRYALRFSMFLWFISPTARAQETTERTLPKILMLDTPGVTPNDPVLYEAIRAQLSAAPLILDRIVLPDSKAFSADPLSNASQTAAFNHAAMTFWIEDKETCELFFYIPDAHGGRISSRTLDLDVNSAWSRFQTIAIAAASMVEGLLVRHHIRPAPKTPQESPEDTGQSVVSKPSTKKKRIEISAAYAGSLFSSDTVTNGFCLGIGVRPFDQFVIAVSFTQNVPLTRTTTLSELTIVSRVVEIAAAGLIRLRAAEIRLGAAWTIDMRSVSGTFSTDAIEPSPEGFDGINALVPFAAVEWRFSDRIGIFARAGASISLNDTVYKIKRSDGDDTDVLAPFIVKFSYGMGLMIHL